MNWLKKLFCFSLLWRFIFRYLRKRASLSFRFSFIESLSHWWWWILYDLVWAQLVEWYELFRIMNNHFYATIDGFTYERFVVFFSFFRIIEHLIWCFKLKKGHCIISLPNWIWLCTRDFSFERHIIQLSLLILPFFSGLKSKGVLW